MTLIKYFVCVKKIPSLSINIYLHLATKNWKRSRGRH